jgi:hypothetical protein
MNHPTSDIQFLAQIILKVRDGDQVTVAEGTRLTATPGRPPRISIPFRKGSPPSIPTRLDSSRSRGARSDVGADTARGVAAYAG